MVEMYGNIESNEITCVCSLQLFIFPYISTSMFRNYAELTERIKL